jgi:hypothetical protein
MDFRSCVGNFEIELQIQVPKTQSVFRPRTHNETFAVIAVSVNNPDCSPLAIQN